MSLSPDSKVRQTAVRLLRRLHAEGRQAGEALPRQEVLRRELGVGNATITGAMALLTTHGVLARIDRVGTQVADLQAAVPGLWQVGLTTYLPAQPLGSSYFADLFMRLQCHLLAAGCACCLYHQPLPRSDGLPPFLSTYSDLLLAADAGAIDGIVTAGLIGAATHARLAAGPVPAVELHGWEGSYRGVVVDQYPLGQQGVRLLAARGCRRFAWVQARPPELYQQRGWQGFCQGLADCDRPASAGAPYSGGFGFAGGQQVAAELLALPRALRPGGVIVNDDWIALGLATALQAAGSYDPALVVQTNRQTPLVFPLPVLRFEVDGDEMARQAVALLQTCLAAPSLPPALRWVAPHLTSATPQALPFTPAPARPARPLRGYARGPRRAPQPV